MRKLSLFLIVSFLISLPAFVQQVNAQQKSDADKEKEEKIQMVIEEQKKAMSEEKKAQYEMQKVLKDQKEMERSLNEMRIDVTTEDISAGEDGDIVKIYGKRGDRPFRFDEPFVFSTGSDNFHVFSYGDNSERTQWDFSKNVKESTFSREYSFDVEKTAKSVIMSVMGDCKAGEIRIKITMPNGKTYSEILIDESGNLNWRKSFTISETENQDKAGEWKYQISSNKATGFFKISLQTN